jgi:hypothetical protein
MVNLAQFYFQEWSRFLGRQQTFGAMMPNYHLSEYKNGVLHDDLGEMALPNDAEAVLLGERIIKDLMFENAENFSDFTLEITSGQRAVASVPYSH